MSKATLLSGSNPSGPSVFSRPPLGLPPPAVSTALPSIAPWRTRMFSVLSIANRVDAVAPLLSLRSYAAATTVGSTPTLGSVAM